VKLGWDTVFLNYQATPGEILPPDCEPAPPRSSSDGGPLLGCSFAGPQSSNSLPLVEVQFQCKQDGVTSLGLVPSEGDPELGTHLLDGNLAVIEPVLSGAVVDCGFTRPSVTPTRTSLPFGPVFEVDDGEEPHYVGEVVRVNLVLASHDLPDTDGDTRRGYYGMRVKWAADGNWQNGQLVWPDCPHVGPLSSLAFVCYVTEGDDESSYLGPVLQVDVPCTQPGIAATFNRPVWMDAQLLSEQGEWDFNRTQPPGSGGGRVDCVEAVPTVATDVPPPTLPPTHTPTPTAIYTATPTSTFTPTPWRTRAATPTVTPRLTETRTPTATLTTLATASRTPSEPQPTSEVAAATVTPPTSQVAGLPRTGARSGGPAGAGLDLIPLGLALGTLALLGWKLWRALDR
jgi:hypothetical protein